MFRFTGTSVHPLDEKRRVTFPKRFASTLEQMLSAGTEFKVTLGLDGCLLFTDLGSFEKTVAGVGSGILADKAERAQRRLLVGHAEDGTPDKSLRLLLSEGLRKSAGIDGTVVMVGVGDSIEIWSEQAWAKRIESTVADAEAFFAKPKSAVGSTVAKP